MLMPSPPSNLMACVSLSAFITFAEPTVVTLLIAFCNCADAILASTSALL